MKFKLFTLALGLLLIYSCEQKEKAPVAEISPPPKISVEDLFKNSEKRTFRISPDGSHISYMASYKTRMNVFVQNLENDSVVRVTHEEDRGINSYFWASNDRLVYIRDQGGNENFHLYSVNKDGTDEKDLTPFEGVRAQVIDILKSKPTEMIIGLNKRNPQIFDPYRINIETGAMKLLYENPGNITGWMTDHNGQLRLAFATNGVDQTILYRKNESGPFKEVITTNFRETLNPQFFDFEDPNTIYAVSNLNRDKMAVVKFDLAEKKETEKIYEHEEVDIDGLYYSEKRKVLLWAEYTTDKMHRHFLDDESKAMFSDLGQQVGEGYEFYITASDKAEENFLVYAGNDLTRGSYYSYDLGTKTSKHLADLSPWIKAEHMAEMKPISYTSRDGLTIHGYLTLPKGVEATNLPVVINPHGGPWARDVWGYNPEVQLLANRGYAVLQMNFRGSTGYGKKFWEISFKQWGQDMQNDVTDGVKWLIDQGIADPERVAIYGGSYGGYATLAGITNTPDLYAAAVDYVGVSNLFTFMETIPPYWEPYREMLYEMVGNPATADSVMLRANSPVFHVDKIKAALFIAQGANDPRVVQAESDQMVEALRNNGVTVQYMLKEDEGHGFYNQENRFDFYNAMTDFLDRELKVEEEKIKT